MAVSKSILGMNARNFLYIRRYNSGEAKWGADDKLITKQLLLKHHIATPELIAKFIHPDDIKNFSWKLPENGFAIKPARGYGGGGILVFKSWDGEIAKTTSDENYSKKQIQSHLFDIFDGAYSLHYIPDKALIEKIVYPDPFFKKIGAQGVPDIRIVVFRKIPIMAMMRIPTKESNGKANLHLGAIGVGIDIRTGIAVHAIYKKKQITLYPDSQRKIVGIKIPKWHEILLLASKVASISGLGYLGVDIVLDEKDGPLVIEINARPGLGIQIANMASLRTRMERVEDMYIPTPERGVEIAQSLFSEHYSMYSKTSPKILTVIQPVVIHGVLKEKDIGVQKEKVYAKLDSGAYRTSIDKKLAQKLNLTISDKKIYVQSASGTGYPKTVNFTFELAGKKIKSTATVTDRSHLRFPIIIGRLDLKGFLINPDYGDVPLEDKDKVEEH